MIYLFEYLINSNFLPYALKMNLKKNAFELYRQQTENKIGTINNVIDFQVNSNWIRLLWIGCDKQVAVVIFSV